MKRLWIVALASVLAGCTGSSDSDGTVGGGTNVAPQTGFRLTSTSFAAEETIPVTHTGEGDDTSPPLAWADAPEGTQSFALFCDDPDAMSDDPWVHWVIFNIPADTTELSAGMSKDPEPAAVAGARQGTNGWPSENIGYRGPMPPEGDGPHHYHFQLFALDTVLELEAGASKEQLVDAMNGHQLGKAELVGVFERAE